MLHGIDSSKWQAGLPDKTIQADFIIFKATEGVGYTDPDCNPSYQEAKAAGKLVGVYHFARPDGNDPISEANWFVSQIKGYIGEAILALDFETAPFDPNWAKQWLDKVYELTGVRPLFYSYLSVLNSHDWSSVWGNYGLWLAEPGVDAPTSGYNPPAFTPSCNGNWNIAIWQYNTKTILPGWGGALDADLFYGDANAWKAYAAGHSNPVTPPVVTPPVVTPVVVPPVVTPPVVIPPVTPPVDPNVTDNTNFVTWLKNLFLSLAKFLTSWRK